MSRLVVVLALLLALTRPASAQITPVGDAGPYLFIPQSQPATTLEGTVYQDSTTHVFMIYNGSAWVAAGSGGTICPGNGTTSLKQVATNDLGIYTGATNCVGGTLRFDVSATQATFTNNPVLSIIASGSGIALNGSNVSTTQPAIVGSSTGYYAGLFYNITDLGSSGANANAIGLVSQSVYSNAFYAQQGAVSGSGSTLARTNILPAAYVTRVVSNLNGFDYTAPLLTVEDTTASTGLLLSLIKQGSTKFSVTNAGVLQTTGTIFSNGGSLETAATGLMFFNTRAVLGSSADKLLQVTDNAALTGMELNAGTPALGTCTAGSLTSGSHNFAGEITGNTSGSCILNFGTPSFTNTPICFAMSRTSTTHPRISAASASSITITGGVSGEAIGYHCDGRIGT